MRIRVIARSGVAVILTALTVGSAAPPRDADGRAMTVLVPLATTDGASGRAGAAAAAPPAAPTVIWSADAAAIESVRTGDGLGGRIVTALDHGVPFAWRRYVGELVVGCRPVGDLACPGGVVDRRDRVTISPDAARWSEAELLYVLRHELAHVWQYATGDLDARRRDLVGVAGLGGVEPLEAGAECLAALWGSPSDGAGYLDCPEAGVDRMADVFHATPLPVPAPGR